jgi:hypothetical protein
MTRAAQTARVKGAKEQRKWWTELLSDFHIYPGPPTLRYGEENYG